MKDSQRLTYRPWKRSDVDTMVELKNDPMVLRGLGLDGKTFTHDNAKDVIRGVKTKSSVIGQDFAVCLKSTKEIIGEVSVVYDPQKKVNISGAIWIAQKYQGQGYGREVLRARNEYCFNELGLDTVNTSCLSDNRPSRNMQKKLGFRVFDVKDWEHNGKKNVKLVRARLTKRDYQKHEGALG